VSAALPDATIDVSHRWVSDLTRFAPQVQASDLHHCHLVVRIPGVDAAQARARLEALAPELGVRLATVQTKPGERGEYVAYHGPGVLGLDDIDEDFLRP
jgi:hypothetical protein